MTACFARVAGSEVGANLPLGLDTVIDPRCTTIRVPMIRLTSDTIGPVIGLTSIVGICIDKGTKRSLGEPTASELSW